MRPKPTLELCGESLCVESSVVEYSNICEAWFQHRMNEYVRQPGSCLVGMLKLGLGKLRFLVI